MLGMGRFYRIAAHASIHLSFDEGLFKGYAMEYTGESAGGWSVMGLSPDFRDEAFEIAAAMDLAVHGLGRHKDDLRPRRRRFDL